MRGAARREGVLRRRTLFRFPVTPAVFRTGVVAGLLGVLAGCGGGGTRGTSTGSVAVRASWERSSHGGGAATERPPIPGEREPIPPSVSTVEVRVNVAGGQEIRTFADPRVTREVVIEDLRVGPAIIQVFGYDLAFADRSLLNDFTLPPSYESAPVPVLIRPNQTTDAGVVQLRAQPFATDFDPALGAAGVSTATEVSFVFGTAVGDIDLHSINISIAGAAVVTNGSAPGALLVPCDDSRLADDPPCGRRSDRMLKGFLFVFDRPAPYAANSRVEVVVSAADTNPLPRGFSDFRYHFTTGEAAATPSATAEGTATATPTASATLTRAIATNTPTPTPTRTPPPTSTPTRTSEAPTLTFTPTRTRTATATASDTPTPTPTDTPTPLPRTYVVTTTANDGAGSLRQAILEANVDEQASTITFDPALAGQTIAVVDIDLPPIEDNDTTINGDINADGRPDIRIDGPGADLGIEVFADRFTLQGLALSSFSVAVVLEVEADNAVVHQCYIGLGLDGATDAHNFDAGIEVHGSNHRISNSVISANLGFAIDIADDASNVVITGNTIGADAGRTTSLGNGDDGVSIADSAGHVIGGTGPGKGNFIVGNTGSGIAVVGFEGRAHDITIQGNQIGHPDLRGNIEGITIIDTSRVLIGGREPGAGNVIQANDGAGVFISGAASIGVTLSQNLLAVNGDVGIARLDGAQTLVSPPVIQLSDRTITGTGAANATIEIFATDEPPDASDAGEGETFLGSVQSDANGMFSFPLPQADGLPVHVTATLTDAIGNTSAFAQNVEVAPAPTDSPTPTPTETAVPTPSPPATATEAAPPTPAETATATASVTATLAESSTPTPTDTATAGETATPTATPTQTGAPTPTETPALTDTPTPGDTATPTATATESATATVTATETPAPTPTETVTPVETATAGATATATVTPTPSATETPAETLTPTATPSETPTPTATSTPTPTPTFSGFGLAYVSNFGSDSVALIDVGTRTVVGTVLVGRGPFGVAVNTTGTRVYVTNLFDRTLSVIDTADHQVVDTLPVGTLPRGVAVNPSGKRVYIANQLSGSLTVIDTTMSEVSTLALGGSPYGVAVNPVAEAQVLVTNAGGAQVFVIDTLEATVDTVAVGNNPFGIDITPPGTFAYVANSGSDSVSVINTDTHAVTTVGVGMQPVSLAVHPAGTQVYVANHLGNSVSVINTAGNEVVATIPVMNNPFGISVDAAGAQVFVTNFNGKAVSVINTSDHEVKTVDVENGPVAFGRFTGPSNGVDL